MFHQALNTSVYMTNIFVLFSLCTFVLLWCNHSIDAARLPPLKSYNRWLPAVKRIIFLPNFLIFWRYVFQGVAAISNLLCNGRGWGKWSLKTFAKGEAWSKNPQIKRYVKVNLCSLIFLLHEFTTTYLLKKLVNVLIIIGHYQLSVYNVPEGIRY